MIETTLGLSINFIVVTLGAFTVGMVMEMLRPAREGEVSISRWLNNGGLALLTYVVSHFFSTFVAVSIIYSLGSGPLLGLTNRPLWIDVSATFLVLELARYSLHIAMHKFPFLWRFHAVHHSDKEVDVSTAFRHHPLEAMINIVPISAVVWLLGSAPEVLVLYRAGDLIMAILTHANIDVPARLERWLRYIVVTPAFHRTHHLAEKCFTDSNYSASVPWFDYLFSTYQPTTAEQQKFAKIGLNTYTANEQRIDGMLYAPFVARTLEPDGIDVRPPD